MTVRRIIALVPVLAFMFLSHATTAAPSAIASFSQPLSSVELTFPGPVLLGPEDPRGGADCHPNTRYGIEEDGVFRDISFAGFNNCFKPGTIVPRAIKHQEGQVKLYSQDDLDPDCLFVISCPICPTTLAEPCLEAAGNFFSCNWCDDGLSAGVHRDLPGSSHRLRYATLLETHPPWAWAIADSHCRYVGGDIRRVKCVYDVPIVVPIPAT